MAQERAQERSIEVKVGILIVVSAIILGAFILMMGGINFEKTYAIYIDFDNPSGLQPGAAVRLAGIKVGSVKELSFLGGKIDPKTGRRTLVRVKASVEERYRDAIHDDADFFITTQGVLGEQFLAIEPGSPNRPVLAGGEDHPVKGIDPPRLDLFLAKAYELLDTTVNGIRNNKELISDIATNTASLLRGLSGVVNDNRDRIQRTMQNFEAMSQELITLTDDARKNYVDNPKLLKTVDNIDALATALRTDAEPMLQDARESLANLHRLTGVVGDEQGAERTRKMLQDIAQLASRANTTAGDAQAIVAHVRKGEGTVGALLMDEQIYDDVQEMLRDLKHNPWKFFWKE